MAKKFSTPGVVLNEVDISEVLAPAGTSIGVTVGKALKGLANARKLITTDKDMNITYGDPESDSTKDFGEIFKEI